MTDERMLEEFSRMNNELIDARRELMRVNAELAEKDRFLARILDLSPNIIYVYDLANGRNEYANREIAATLGYGPGDVAEQGEGFLSTVLHPDDRARGPSHRAALRAARDGEIMELEYRVRSKAGEWRWVGARETVFDRGADGLPRRAIGIADDITERIDREARLKEDSLFDQLTGARNRRGFEELAGQQLLIAARKGSPCAVLYVDLDRFKEINDGYGHAEGDEALRAAADILRKSLRAGDILARSGGDEFVALLVDTGEGAMGPPLERLSRRLRRFNEGSGKPWRLGLSIGRAIFDPSAPEGLGELVARADEAMYQAKRDGPQRPPMDIPAKA